MADLVLSLFPGADLLGHAFTMEGFSVVTGPDVIWGGDIRTFHPPAGRFDGIIGGPPCQSFSPLVHLVRACGREPRHGNLIPEYERVVAEARPSWFLMEEVPQAPVPVVEGYAVHSFILDNCWLGEAQMRRRRFSFGALGEKIIDLRRWIQQAALELPDAVQAVAGDSPAVPVAIGWSGKVKQSTVRGKNDGNMQPWELAKQAAVIAREADASPSHDIHRRKPRSWAECCELQGLPPDFLSEAPFTSEGKRRLLGNGVPIPMGRALAKAIHQFRETSVG